MSEFPNQTSSLAAELERRCHALRQRLETTAAALRSKLINAVPADAERQAFLDAASQWVAADDALSASESKPLQPP